MPLFETQISPPLTIFLSLKRSHLEYVTTMYNEALWHIHTPPLIGESVLKTRPFQQQQLKPDSSLGFLNRSQSPSFKDMMSLTLPKCPLT